MKNIPLLLLVTVLSISCTGSSLGEASALDKGIRLTGELKKWHKITLTFDGPDASENAKPNPFLDYRLNVTFRNEDKTYLVPGYFAADGNAVESSASAGNKWRVHFAPDKTGTWTFTASFRKGDNVAVSTSATAGTATSLDGKTGSFTIAKTDKTGVDLRGKGRLQYTGEHHLRFAETHEYFIKQGTDSPENLLAYNDFDNTPNTGKRCKSWSAHVRDWKKGDPTWKNGKGKGLIGAVNYLSSKGMNAFSFLTMNIMGDDKNVYPFVSDKNRKVFDCSKMDQWEIIFEHADKMGMYLHFKMQETENDKLLDSGDLGIERRVYYRELIARYSHHLALNWNIGEENYNTTEQQKDFIQYFHDNDPYRHLVVLHTWPIRGRPQIIYTPLLGSKSKLTGVSFQSTKADFSKVFPGIKEWVDKSAKAGKKWVVACDEPGDPGHAIRPDNSKANSHEDGRKNALWGTIMAGGAGCEYFFGMHHAHNDLTCEDFRSRDQWFDYCRYALEFFHDNKVPFSKMSNSNHSSNKDSWCLSQNHKHYVVLLKKGGSTQLNLTGISGSFTVKWFDPRNGGSLKIGSVKKVKGGSSVSLGIAPNDPGKDWVVYVKAD